MKTECIKEEIFMDYMENRLPLKRRDAVEKHIAECDDCLSVLSVMAEDHEISALEPVPGHVTRQAVRKVKDLAKKSIRGKLSGYVRHFADTCSDALTGTRTFKTPAPVAVRSRRKKVNDDVVHLRHTVLDLKAEVEIEKKNETEASVRVNLTGKVGPANHVRISLILKGREIASYLDYDALFEDVPPGQYVLRFTVFREKKNKIVEFPIQVS